jgi:hypothetical protein
MQTIRFALLGGFALLLAVGQIVAQDDGRGPRGPGRGPRGNRDPNEMFNSMTNGKDVWSRADITDSWRQQFFDRVAEQVGSKNGQITREQYVSYMQKRMAERSGGITPPSSDASQVITGSPSEKTKIDATGSINTDVWSNAAESSFRRRDTNNDGYLDWNEMTDELRAELDLWDKDGNRMIDLNEYKAYYIARREQQMAERNAAAYDRSAYNRAPMSAPMAPAPTQPAEERRPLVYTYKNIPKELKWFQDLDRDKDGQVGLYEWKLSGRSMEEFRKYDRNNDGFITVEEVLYVMAQEKKNNADGGAGNSRVVRKDTNTGGPSSISTVDLSGVDPSRFDRGKVDSAKPAPIRATFDFSKAPRSRGPNKDK